MALLFEKDGIADLFCTIPVDIVLLLLLFTKGFTNLDCGSFSLLAEFVFEVLVDDECNWLEELSKFDKDLFWFVDNCLCSLLLSLIFVNILLLLLLLLLSMDDIIFDDNVDIGDLIANPLLFWLIFALFVGVGIELVVGVNLIAGCFNLDDNLFCLVWSS